MSREHRSDLVQKGKEIRRSVFDEAYVQSVSEDPNEQYQAYVDLMSEVVWARVWSESAVSEENKLRINIAVFTAIGDAGHARPYIDSALAHGISRQEIADIITQTALYAGFPKGYHAMYEFCDACRQQDDKEQSS